ncbi:hypothetical protein RQP46_001926 [Phenoliferia psychrophenolica]
MESELHAASAFLSAYLAPSSQAPFEASLVARLSARFAHHWHPSDPERGSAFRAIVRHGATLDPILLLSTSLLPSELSKALLGSTGPVPLGLRWTLWVDPGCVSLRVDGMDGQPVGRGREGVFVEIWGKLPESLRSHAVPLDQVGHAAAAAAAKGALSPGPKTTTTPPPLSPDKAFLENSPTGTEADPSFLSPTKRSSKAIQILRPPSRPTSAFSLASLQSHSSQSSSSSIFRPTSPLPMSVPTPLLASPFIIPPTPARPSSTPTDVFSPAPSNLALSAPSRPHSPLGHHNGSTRSSSRGSNSDDGSSLFSGSGRDDDFFDRHGTSPASSISSSPSSTLWKTSDGNLMDGEFKYPPLPPRSSSTSAFAFPPAPPHTRSHSSQSHSSHASSASFFSPPPSPTKSSHGSGTASAPTSPTKPRRRGTRGGGSSSAHHAASSSITSLSSDSSSSRTREQAMAGTLTEHSGGKVGVLGGGVLLGLASAARMGSARAEVVGESKRRGRERRRGANPTAAQGKWEGGEMGHFGVPAN